MTITLVPMYQCYAVMLDDTIMLSLSLFLCKHFEFSFDRVFTSLVRRYDRAKFCWFSKGAFTLSVFDHVTVEFTGSGHQTFCFAMFAIGQVAICVGDDGNHMWLVV